MRDRPRALQEADSRLDKPHRRHRWMTVADFETLCAEVGEVGRPAALLSFLHETGVVFHDEKRWLFDDWSILDQTWALDEIYTVFDRARVVPSLHDSGRFTLEDVDALVWGEDRRLHTSHHAGRAAGGGDQREVHRVVVLHARAV